MWFYYRHLLTASEHRAASVLRAVLKTHALSMVLPLCWLPALPEESLALHNLIWCERLLRCHEHKDLDPEGLGGRAWPLQVSKVVLNQLLQAAKHVEEGV